MAFPYKRMTDADFERIRGITSPERVLVGADIPEDYFHDEMPEYGVYPPVYFSEGRLGFLVETVPSLDGYAGFSIDIRQVRDLLRTDNPVIAMLCGLSDAQDS